MYLMIAVLLSIRLELRQKVCYNEHTVVELIPVVYVESGGGVKDFEETKSRNMESMVLRYSRIVLYGTQLNQQNFHKVVKRRQE